MKWSGGQRADGFKVGAVTILVLVSVICCTADQWGEALDRASALGTALWFPWGVLALGLLIGTLVLR